MQNKQQVISILQNVLGSYQTHKNNEYAFNCPFCHHYKKKLQVNIKTQKFHCWVCDAKGSRIKSLLIKLKVDSKSIQTIKDIYGDDDYNYNPNEDYPEKLELPKEFKPLYIKPKSINPIYSKAISYLKQRKIGMDLIIKYNIGYCDSGDYGGRIIIPSYDENNELNYFEARTFYDNVSLKYKKPPVSRNIIMFENQINWNFDNITIVEGVFDAFSVRRNVIPMLGKFLLPKLKSKILEYKPKLINLCLDGDAMIESLKLAEFFIKNDINVKIVNIADGCDIADIGFDESIKMIKNSKAIDIGDIIVMKIGTL